MIQELVRPLIVCQENVIRIDELLVMLIARDLVQMCQCLHVRPDFHIKKIRIADHFADFLFRVRSTHISRVRFSLNGNGVGLVLP